MSRYRLSEAAGEDIEAILRNTTRNYGPRQRERYIGIIQLGIEMVASEPKRPGSRARLEIHPEIRSFHLELAAGRAGAAVHHLYYTMQRLADGEEGIVILRVLHERTDARRQAFDINS